MERGEDNDDADQVQLMTLHASERLRKPMYSWWGRRGILPIPQTSVDEGNVEEERRLMYVGITRAQKELTFTKCRERGTVRWAIKPTQSRLDELPHEDVTWESVKNRSRLKREWKKGRPTLRIIFVRCSIRNNRQSFQVIKGDLMVTFYINLFCFTG